MEELNAATITKRAYGVGRKFKRGKVWWVAVYNGFGSEIRESTHSRKECDADEKLEQMVAGRLGEDVEPPSPSLPTLNGGRVSVYFLKPAGVDRVKIGFTVRDVHSRRKALQAGCPTPLECLLVLRGESSATERVIHNLLARYRVEGTTEWFYLTEPVRNLIECLRQLSGSQND